MEEKPVHAKHPFQNDRGAALVIALMFLGILALAGSTAVVLTSTDLQIAGNYKTSVEAFNSAQAGIEEARARLRGNADSSIRIPDTSLAYDYTDPSWKTYIGTVTLAQNLSGYASGDTIVPSVHTFTDMDYAVQIVHALDDQDLDGDGNKNEVLFWGDSDANGVSERNTTTGNNIYLVTAYGTAGGANQTLTVEITRMPPVTVPAALYVEEATAINAADTEISGIDTCGSGVPLPGVATTMSSSTVTCPTSKTPDCGDNVEGNPPIRQAPDTPNLDIQRIIDDNKDFANITHPGGTDSSVNWGVPTNLKTYPDCNNVSNIVYVSNSLHLSAHSTGCGILLVDGDLRATGGLEWYGLVIVSGCLDNYSGSGGDDGVAGSIMSGGNCKTGNMASGKTRLHYCSTAVEDAAQNLPLKILSWKDDF